MKMLVQRVTSASVEVERQTIAKIGFGLLIYVGFTSTDNLESAIQLADKVMRYRIFSDDYGRMSLSLTDVGGDALWIPQFTLAAKTTKGLRPDFKLAMPYDQAQEMFQKLINDLSNRYTESRSQHGQFGADMQVRSQNDGPINFILDA